jgi:hypothetical protein
MILRVKILVNTSHVEYVLEFVVNAVIQIESLVGDISKPFAV